MRRFQNLARIIGLLSVTVALSACSAIKLGYNALPQMSLWWLDGYVDFSDDQEQRVRDDLARLQLWHRRQELPRVAALLQRAERLVMEDEATPDEVCALVPDVRARFLAFAEGAEPSAATLASSLNAEQLVHLERKYQKNNRKYRKDWVELAPEDLREKRFKQYLDRMEMLYGRFDEPQRAVMRAQVEQSVFDAQANLLERQRRQQDILQGLRKLAGQPAPPPEARSILHGLVERGLQSPDPRYRAYQESLIQEGCRNIAAVHQGTTPRQRDHAVQRLRGYQRDLGDLVAAR